MDAKKSPTGYIAGSLGDEPASGGAITSGWIIAARSNPASSEIIDVLVIPPGTKTLTVTPVPSRSFAMIALSARLGGAVGG